jgi:ATP phosphoribosyltransferase
LRVALTKGRLEDSAAALFQKAGFDCSALLDKGRRLILPVTRGGYTVEAVLAKAPDVITYVESGVCDIGVVGKDIITEYSGKFFELADLGLGRCKLVLAGRSDEDFYEGYKVRRIATKYPNTARAFFERKGMDVDIVRIEGSVELAPLLDLADAIVDIVETGATLRENGLLVIEEISEISARLIVNTVSLKLRQAEIERFAEAIVGAVDK